MKDGENFFLYPELSWCQACEDQYEAKIYEVVSAQDEKPVGDKNEESSSQKMRKLFTERLTVKIAEMHLRI